MALTPRMQVDRYKIHDIEVVVDRLQVTEDMKLRLSQSVQKSLQIGKDLPFLQPSTLQRSTYTICIDVTNATCNHLKLIPCESFFSNDFFYNEPRLLCLQF
jgi:excinuclease UvrABC ATPase subunit